MLTILLKVLQVIGIVLFVLLAVVLTLLLLVLFMPVTYRISADRKRADDAKEGPAVFQNRLSAKVNWLFGLLRIRYAYPEPGELRVKVLFFTLYRMDFRKKEEVAEGAEADGKPPEAGAAVTGTEAAATETDPGNDGIDYEALGSEAETAEDFRTVDKTAQMDAESGRPEPGDENAQDFRTTTENGSAQADTEPGGATHEEPEPQEEKKENFFEKISSKVRGICDKIKNIKENVDHYREIFLCDETRELFDHAFMRLGKVLKSIRPRKLKANVRFGTGSPDTTGYILGIYSMLRPGLGGQLVFSPDFEEAVLEGEIYAAGHVCLYKLVWHGVRLLLDRRLRRLMHKLKKKENQ